MKDNKFNIGDKVRIRGSFFTARIVDLIPQKNTEYFLKMPEGIRSFCENELDYTLFHNAIVSLNKLFVKLLLIRIKIEDKIISYDFRRNDIHRTTSNRK